MRINEYQYYCSNEILKLLNSLVDDSNVSSLSDRYNSLFDESSKVNYVWSLVSTSLLMSENFYRYDKAYRLISDDVIGLIEDTLYLYPIVYPDDDVVSPCLLDSKNHVADSFLHYIPINYDPDEYCDYSKLDDMENFDEKAYYEGEIRLSNMLKEREEKFEQLRIDGPYGCNDSIIEDGCLNVRKFIERTRNALAHSNYEVLDEKNIRLYHYNRGTKKLDFNVILDPSVIVLIVDELNEIANEKYSEFMESYVQGPSEKWMHMELNDEVIKKYILSFDVVGEDEVASIIEGVNSNETFTSLDVEKQFEFINKLIYEKIKPSYDAGVIINDYLYCNPDRRIVSDSLYEKYDIFQYLSSDFYNTSTSNANDDVYVQNKFKFLLLSLLESSILNGYNFNENKEIGTIDFSGMHLDEEILKLFLIQNGVKSFKKKELLEQLSDRNIHEINKKIELINKKQALIDQHNLDNDYFNIVLPTQIHELENDVRELGNQNVINVVEIEKIKSQGCMYNYEENLSHFIFNHLRNSLAHGYVKFPNNINLSNVSDMMITFEDYNPDNKKELTFRGTMKFGDLLTVITSCEYVNNVLGMDTSKSSGSLKK